MTVLDSLPRQFRDVDYTMFRKNLLRKKGNERQKIFLSHVRNSDNFVRLLGEIESTGADNISLTPWPLTESEFKDPPVDTERTLYASWSHIPPAVACRSTFWAYLTFEHVRQGRIQSVYLAGNGGTLTGGERIDQALADSTERAPRLIDSCVRTVLRRLGGLPEVRGNRSVYVDCPFARTWWRERMIIEAGNGDSQIEANTRAVLRIHQTYWEKIIDRIVFRNSTFGSKNIRNAFIRALGDHLASDPSSNLKETNILQRLCRRASAYQGSRELCILSDEILDSLMQSIIETVHAP